MVGTAMNGVRVPVATCLIAAAAVGIDAGLATANVADFPMDELRVERWSADG